MENRTLLAVSLVAAIALAGCTALPGGGGDAEEVQQRFQITQNDGLTVSFQSLQGTYFEDGEIQLELDLQNTGESGAENIEAELFGASFLAGDTVDLSRTTLRAVDRAAEQPGGIATGTYRQSNPVDLRQGQTRTFPAGVRVMYDYTTEAAADFRVIPREELTGQSSTVTTENTAGPIKADIEVQSPKPVSRDPDADSVQFSIPVTVRNVAGGDVVSDIQGNRGEVEMEASFPLASDDVATITDCGGSGEASRSFQFPRGRTERQITCTAEISQGQFDTQLSMEVDLDYTYFETAETTFQIEGLSGDQTPS